MNKYILILLSVFFAISASSQNDAKSLEGAVPEVDGKVIFERIIKPRASISDEKLYDLMAEWAKNNYKSNDEVGLSSRVLLENAQEMELACYGEEYLVFKKNYLVHDRAKMSYQLILKIDQGKCNVSVRAIRYDYDGENNLPAEEMISDKVALNSKKRKLNNYYGKFREHTVDVMDRLFTSIETHLSGEEVADSTPVDSQEAVIDLNNEQLVTKMPNYTSFSADKIPSKLINNWTLISSGSKNSPNAIVALWGGVGTIGTNDVAFSLLNQAEASVKVLDKEDSYIISFYTEIYEEALHKFTSTEGSIEDKIKASGLTPIQTPSGVTTFSEAWMIIECKKGTAQPSPHTSVVGVDSTNKTNYSQTYIGEILNVWVK